MTRRTAACASLLLACAGSCAPPSAIQPPPAAVPPQTSASASQPPASIRIAVLVPADAISLRPRVEVIDEPADAKDPQVAKSASFLIVVPLPEQRSQLRRVDVTLSVTSHADGRVVHQQRAVFSRYTEGDALRLYVPPLPGGRYAAEIRTQAQVEGMGPDGSVEVNGEDDSAVVDLASSAPPAAAPATTHSFTFHFQKGHATLAELDEREIEESAKRIRFVLMQNKVSRAQVDCWASTEGERRLNWRLSEHRCSWVRHSLWDRRLRDASKPKLDAAAHGPDNPPHAEPDTDNAEEAEKNRSKNRVAVLRLFVDG